MHNRRLSLRMRLPLTRGRERVPQTSLTVESFGAREITWFYSFFGGTSIIRDYMSFVVLETDLRCDEHLQEV